MSTLAFTSTTPTDLAGSNSTTGMIDWREPEDDQGAQFEQIPYYGTAVKYNTAGGAILETYEADIYLTAASATAIRTAVDAWKALKGSTGTVTATTSGREKAVTNATLASTTDRVYLTHAFMTLTFTVVRTS